MKIKYLFICIMICFGCSNPKQIIEIDYDNWNSSSRDDFFDKVSLLDSINSDNGKIYFIKLIENRKDHFENFIDSIKQNNKESISNMTVVETFSRKKKYVITVKINNSEKAYVTELKGGDTKFKIKELSSGFDDTYSYICSSSNNQKYSDAKLLDMIEIYTKVKVEKGVLYTTDNCSYMHVSYQYLH